MTVDLRKAYGQRVREAREYVGMNQRTLAGLMALDTATVQRFESGEQPLLGGDLDRLVEIFQHPREFYFTEPITDEFDEGRVFVCGDRKAG